MVQAYIYKKKKNIEPVINLIPVTATGCQTRQHYVTRLLRSRIQLKSKEISLDCLFTPGNYRATWISGLCPASFYSFCWPEVTALIASSTSPPPCRVNKRHKSVS